MNKILASSLIIGAAAAGPALGSNNLTPAQKAAILTRFAAEVKYNFVHYDRLTCNFDSLCYARFDTIVNHTDDYDFQRQMALLCAQLHDGHTSVWIPVGRQTNEELVRPLPFQTVRLGDDFYVKSVRSSVFADKGVAPGTQVIAIDGEPVADYFRREVAPYLSSSTPQYTEWLGGSDFYLTKKTGAEPTEVTFINAKGKPFSVSSGRLVSWDIELPKSDDTFITDAILEGNIGHLTVKSFNEGFFNIDTIDAALRRLADTDALIIDLRDNQGGNSSYADYLLRKICEGEIPGYPWSTTQYRAAFASWGRANPPYRTSTSPMQGEGVYTKPVALLVNRGTFSSAEDFINLFRGANRGLLFGEPTAGSTGNPIVIELPFGAFAHICTRNEWTPAGEEFIGVGFTPDVEVVQSPDIFRGKDNVLDAAHEHLLASLGKKLKKRGRK
jgi:C-terminal processing protease CtpA/Prc